MKNLIEIKVKDFILKLIKKFNNIKELYIFGSRGFKTTSYSSDIDLLIYSSSPISLSELNEFTFDEFEMYDLFLTTDKVRAVSAGNGTYIDFDPSKKYCKNIIDQLDAKILWKDNNFDSKIDEWVLKYDKNSYAPKSILPYRTDSSVIKNNCFFSGSNSLEISKKVIDIIAIVLNENYSYSKRAKKFSPELLKLNDEYDFQNLLQFSLRTIYRDIEREPFVIKFDNNKKNADFSLNEGKVVIEAKFISDTNQKNSVLKTLEGLKNFYSLNPRVESLIFLIIYNPNVEIDTVKLESSFSRYNKNIEIIVKFYKNPFAS